MGLSRQVRGQLAARGVDGGLDVARRGIDIASRSNCNVMLVEPSPLVEVISVTPAMRPNWRSSGVATAEAMVSGLAPGSAAFTGRSWDTPLAAAARHRQLSRRRAPRQRERHRQQRVATGRR